MKGLLFDRAGQRDVRRVVIAGLCTWETVTIVGRFRYTVTHCTRSMRTIHPALPWIAALGLATWLVHHLVLEPDGWWPLS